MTPHQKATEHLYMLLKDAADTDVFRRTVEVTPGARIVREREMMFTDGTTALQMTVAMPDGTQWRFTPASEGEIARQRQAGRWLTRFAGMRIGA